MGGETCWSLYRYCNRNPLPLVATERIEAFAWRILVLDEAGSGLDVVSFESVWVDRHLSLGTVVDEPGRAVVVRGFGSAT